MKCIRGQSGVFALAPSAHKISVAKVLDLVGHPLYSAESSAQHSCDVEVCPHFPDCSVRPVWSTLQATVTGVLEQNTPRDLLRDENEMTLFIDYLANNRRN